MNHFQLPIQLADQLTLRWATESDTDRIAVFNGLIHEEGPSEKGIIEDWTRDLLSGRHPTVEPKHFTVIEDKDQNLISSLCVIPQNWNYGGITFPVGRIELVGTLDEWRGKGLVRKQMQVIHDLSIQQGHLWQTITGIPWFYRQFGYEMGLDLGGGQGFLLPHQAKPSADETLCWRKATIEDIPVLERFYRQHCRASSIFTERTPEVWAYLIGGQSPRSVYARDLYIVETVADKTPVAYLHFAPFNSFVVFELGHDPRASLREIGLFLGRSFKHLAGRVNLEPDRKQPITRIFYQFGPNHPIYEALKPELEPDMRHYAWYVRIPDYKAFIDHIRPVLEQRLARSVMAGHSGTFKLNFYRSTLTLTFTQGKLTQIGSYSSEKVGDGHVNLPDQTFISLICGRHSLEDIRAIRPDAFGNAEGRVLIDILFPKQPSNPVGLT